MFKPSCSKARRLVLESEGRHIGSADALWLESHISECETCRQESRELTTLLDAWREAEPPALSADRVARIERAVLEARIEASASAPRPARTWRLPVAAAAVAATVALGSLGYLQLMQWQSRAPSRHPAGKATASNLTPKPKPATVLHGTVRVLDATGAARAVAAGSTVPWFAHLQPGPASGASVRIGKGGATFGLAPGARVTLRRKRGDTVLELSEGALALDVPATVSGALRVRIPGRGEVVARDTRFVVTRSGPRLAVSVLRGKLRYRWYENGKARTREVQGATRLTHLNGQVASTAGTPRVDAAALLAGRGVAPGASSKRPCRRSLKPAPTRTVAKAAPKPDCSVKRIRQTLGRRASLLALREIEQCRGAGLASVELRALEAQANLLAGRVRRAYTQYLAVAHNFQGSSAAQQALYSAGRIALRRLERRAQARRLLKHYLHVYPRGTHRTSVRQLLRTI